MSFTGNATYADISGFRQKPPELFYPQYYYSCLCSFVSRAVHSLCWSCGGAETINCFREFHPDSVENVVIESEACL